VTLAVCQVPAPAVTHTPPLPPAAAADVGQHIQACAVGWLGIPFCSSSCPASAWAMAVVVVGACAVCVVCDVVWCGRWARSGCVCMRAVSEWLVAQAVTGCMWRTLVACVCSHCFGCMCVFPAGLSPRAAYQRGSGFPQGGTRRQQRWVWLSWGRLGVGGEVLVGGGWGGGGGARGGGGGMDHPHA
jgi:uncharacterized membrane protein YgcG